MKKAVQWSSRVYRLLVNAYPKHFLDEYVDEMVWCFEDMCTASIRKRGLRGLIKLWLRTLPDWGFTVIKEHLHNLGLRGAHNMDYTQFNTQLTSTLALFSRALRSGNNVKQAVEIITQYAPEPTKAVFDRLLTKVESGTAWLDAFEEISGEVKSQEFDKVMNAMRTQIAEGGNLADRLDEVNRDIYTVLGDTAWAKAVDLQDGYDFDEHYPLQ